jgi:signal transduction histidine kinase
MPEGNEQDPTRRRLQRLERLLACFQKALGHELPNQLIAIGGLLRLLELEEVQRLGPEGQDYLARVNAAVQKLQVLGTTLANLARLARTPDLPTAEQVEAALGTLGQAVEETVIEVKQLFPGRVIEYHISTSAHSLTVSRPDLRTVLRQLLSHAVQRSGSERPLRVEIDARPGPAALELTLTDDGPELPVERQTTLFEPFPSGGQDNLGLFLVQQIVDGWGGSIALSSRPGQGSTFTIRIP